MYVVGLTGGIASGKSTVASTFVSHGGVLIDADQIAREVVEPGSKGLVAIRERFGDSVIGSDGTLEREALAAVVFSDDEARKDLEAITHPLIGAEIAARLAELAPTSKIVILDVPLLVEGGRAGYDTLVVVAANPEVQIERMGRDRGMSREEAMARIAAQAPLEEKIAKADHVIWNEGSIADLEARAEAVWEVIAPAARAKAGGDDA